MIVTLGSAIHSQGTLSTANVHGVELLEKTPLSSNDDHTNIVELAPLVEPEKNEGNEYVELPLDEKPPADSSVDNYIA